MPLIIFLALAMLFALAVHIAVFLVKWFLCWLALVLTFALIRHIWFKE